MRGLTFIWEMANNHGGSMEHAKLIIDRFAEVSKRAPGKCAIKFQFRQLDTFIHKDFQDSDLKYVKRFRSTRLSKEQFTELAQYVRSKGMLVVATPFDNESLQWIKDLDVDIIKVASCSVDDWPLLWELASIPKQVIISTAGASEDTIRKVHNLMVQFGREHAFMHCVGEYPTPSEHANLSRIDSMRRILRNTQLGISTHEGPEQRSIVPYAVAKGCTIIEKHVDVAEDGHTPNAYSVSPEGAAELIEEVKWVLTALWGEPTNEKEALDKLKRGVYLRHDVPAGHTLCLEDFYYAMPCQEGQLNASQVNELRGLELTEDFKRDEILPTHVLENAIRKKKAAALVDEAQKILIRAGIKTSTTDEVELSTHYGIDKFRHTGALIVNKVNREYCKKLIVMLPDQAHPSHHHIRKEETFELLWGDCTLTLNGRDVEMKPGHPVLISREVVHSFKSAGGCVIEEISTTHHKGDSIYDDPEIAKLELRDRKIYARFKAEKKSPPPTFLHDG